MTHRHKPLKPENDKLPIRESVVNTLCTAIEMAIEDAHNRLGCCFTSAEVVQALAMAIWELGLRSADQLIEEVRQIKTKH